MEQLLPHIGDLARIADKIGRPRFTEFLDEGQQTQAESVCPSICARAGCTPYFWGGWSDAARKVLGIFPPGDDPEENVFPITAFRVSIPKGYTLTHRDFLGALIALGIKREVVGDILINGETAFFFVLEQAAPLVENELGLVGRVGVSLQRCSFEEIEAAGICQRFEESTASVASMRLDAVLCAAAHLSRTEASRLVEMGLVAVNGVVCQKPTHTVRSGERLSVRGKGKFLIESDGAQTRKGRLVVHVKRYL